MDDKYAIDIIASGEFVDKDTLVETFVFRANGAVKNGWFDGELALHKSDFKSGADYYEYCESCRRQRREWCEEIVGLIGTTREPESVYITQTVSEIYTAVLMSEVDDE